MDLKQATLGAMAVASTLGATPESKEQKEKTPLPIEKTAEVTKETKKNTAELLQDM